MRKNVRIKNDAIGEGRFVLRVVIPKDKWEKLKKLGWDVKDELKIRVVKGKLVYEKVEEKED